MTGDSSKHGVRPTEEVLRQRLIARRSDYERTRGEAGLGGRLNQRGTTSLWVPGAERPVGGRLRNFVARRPVTAYLSVATIAGLVFGGLALTLSNDRPGSPVQVAEMTTEAPAASSDQTAAGTIEATDLPVADIGAVAASGTPATTLRDPAAVAPPATTETATRLRPTSDDLPASEATAGTIITDEAAAALALRLPPADDTLAMAEVPDRLLTTGSVLPAGDAGSSQPAADTIETATGDDTATTETMAEEAAAEEETASVEAPDASRAATVNASVNMRERPENDATIVAVLPAGSAVEIIDCAQWCEVAASGSRGFVFRRFVEGADG
ncbi:SH3 domain-containing protein [Aurantimonas aggregata]|uniref:SH3 domain-containing protein n=1 Tax=Aurantimonas aggregata TaxID=2047720 RepID=A0A6L9ME16_9HYPH|nr:SH3 domain-containing protein [Aurantimonas aggregata]NDV85910.1 SH3 domain-containing protein [Aurantimonas aggregata]